MSEDGGLTHGLGLTAGLFWSMRRHRLASESAAAIIEAEVRDPRTVSAKVLNSSVPHPTTVGTRRATR